MKSKKKAAMALVLCILFLCTMLFILTTTTPIASPLATAQKTNSPQLKGTTTDPDQNATIQINGAYYNVTSFQITNETVSDIIEEGNYTGPPDSNLTISWNDYANSSVAMSFSTSDVTTYFNGVQLWIGYNNSPPDLMVELVNGTQVDSIWVPSNLSSDLLANENYSIGNFSPSGGWVTLLNENENIVELIPNWTYFILLTLNDTTYGDNTSYYSWGCTNVGSGGATLQLNFTDISDINNTSLWAESSVPYYNCWMIMNLIQLQYNLTLQLPANWTLNQLSADVFNNTDNINYNITGNITGNITEGTGSFNVTIPNGDRMYLAVINFTSITPVSQTHIIENVTNSDGFARIVGNVSEAQRFTLPDDSNNLSIQILIRNTGLTDNLTAEIWTAQFNSSIGAYNLGTNITAVEVPYLSINSTYNWLTLNFTGNFSQGNYFLVIHTKNWTGDPTSGQFYDWASHTSGIAIPPPEGYEIWTTSDNSNNWNWQDVRDPYGNRYWACMQITSYNSTDTKGIGITVNNELVGDNGVWNDTVWTPIPANQGSNVTFNLASNRDIGYNLTYSIFYYNYSTVFSNDTTFFINGIQMANSTQGYWGLNLTSSQAQYDSSTGIATLIFTAQNVTSGEFLSTSINASINAQMSFTNTSSFSDPTFSSIYTHNSSATISLSQESMNISYNPTVNASSVNTIFLNGTLLPRSNLLSGNWTEAPLNLTTNRITVLKNAFNSTLIGQEISNETVVNTTITFLSQVNVTTPIIPYIGTPVTLNVTNVLDNPSNLTVTIINPNGTITNLIGIQNDSSWNATFTPQEIGEYIASVTTNSSNTIIMRDIGNQAIAQNYYIFNVYQLKAGLIEPDVTLNETLTLGTPFNLQIWVRYLPFNASSTPPVNLTNLTVFLNGAPNNATEFYNNATGIAELPITPSSLGNINITLNVTDNAGRNFNESFIVQVVPPSPPSPIPILSLLTSNAAIGQFTMDTLARITTIVLWLIIAILILMRAFFPDTLTRIHKTLLRRQ